MLFNSINYIIFFLFVIAIYWSVQYKKLVYQNLFLLTVSYLFYSLWDIRFLALIIFSTLLDFYAGFKIYNSKSEKNKKIWFKLAVLTNLGFLGFFKYFNFFVESFSNLLSSFNLNIPITSLNIILPVGISFYTFHGLSYLFDIKSKKITPEKSFLNYALFVNFFPLLVAGPIERSTHLLPQIKKKRKFDYIVFTNGLRQIMWGLFKKVVIADTCAVFANDIFSNYQVSSSGELFFGALMFTIQIYGDFSGYTDIALGSSRVLGIELLTNFKLPYFSLSISEFWKKWHISLSSWFRDYLYIPLGGNRKGKWIALRNTYIVFLVSGFWHGANLTFIFWGLLNAIYVTPSIIFSKFKLVIRNHYLNILTKIIKLISTFILTIFAWILFRSNTISDSIHYYIRLFSNIFNKSFIVDLLNIFYWKFGIINFCIIISFFLIEWLNKKKEYTLQDFCLSNNVIRWLFYITITLCILYFYGKQETFIYFQF